LLRIEFAEVSNFLQTLGGRKLMESGNAGREDRHGCFVE
jgi:hypothetical protein